MCWATLTLLCCAIVAKVPRGLCYIFAQLLRLFPFLAKGIVLPGLTESFMCMARFAGMLADLIGHRALSAWKGPNAIRGYVRCANVIKRKAHLVIAPEVSLQEHDLRKFVRSTKGEIYLIVDNLALFEGDAALGKLQTELGFNHDPLGILLDNPMRAVFDSAEHTLTDWMHTF